MTRRGSCTDEGGVHCLEVTETLIEAIRLTPCSFPSIGDARDGQVRDLAA